MKGLGLIIAVFVCHSVWAEKVIQVQKAATVKKAKTLHLGDITEFKNINDKISKKLRRVPLGDGPKVGERRVFTNKALSSVLRQYLKPYMDSYDINLRIPSRVKIENTGYALSKNEIKGRLVEHWKKLCTDCKLRLTDINVPHVNKKWLKHPWEIQFQNNLPKGRFSLPVRLDSVDRTMWIQGKLKVLKKVPVSKTRIAFGERFNKNDFKFTYKEMTYQSGTVPEAEDIKGKKAKRVFQAGDVIFQKYLKREKALERGDLVTVISQANNWRISLQAVAEQGGHVGDTVKLRNPKSEKLLSGKIIAPGEVVVK